MAYALSTKVPGQRIPRLSRAVCILSNELCALGDGEGGLGEAVVVGEATPRRLLAVATMAQDGASIWRCNG